MKKLAVLMMFALILTMGVSFADTMRAQLEDIRKTSMPRAWATASVLTAMDEGGKQTARDAGTKAKAGKYTGSSLFTSLPGEDAAACLNAK